MDSDLELEALERREAKENAALDLEVEAENDAMIGARAVSIIVREVRARAHLPGVLLELGVGSGAVLEAMLDAASFRQGVALDTFYGLPKPGDVDGNEVAPGMFAHPLTEVAKRTVGYDVVHVQGVFPESILGWTLPPIVVAHVDTDLYEPTAAFMALLWPRVVKGGIVFFDDVDNDATPGVRLALAGYDLQRTPYIPLHHLVKE